MAKKVVTKKQKTCSRCKKRKKVESFVKSAKAKDGYASLCRLCWGLRMKEVHKEKKARLEQEALEKSVKKRLADAPPFKRPKRKAAIINPPSADHEIEEANQALKRANGVPVSRKSPIKKLMRELHKHFNEQGAVVEAISFEHGECQVTFRKTETFKL